MSMTPDEFREIRVKHYRSQLALEAALGLPAWSVSNYETGKREIPGDIETTLLRLTGKIHVPCPRCARTITVEWHDGLCGACTQPIPEDT
jgi:hypothetical protein